MSSDALLDRLVRSPRLGLYANRLNEVLADERRRREQFYETMTEAAKQEFINGEVIVHSPVTLKHERVSGMYHRLASTYVDLHQLGKVGHEKLLICLTRNDYEPDICFFGIEKLARFGPRQMKFPAPDMIVEILSPSTKATDRGTKFEDYAAHGVREYWIIDPDLELVEQYLLEGDAYCLRLKMNSGTLRSEVISGFEVPVRALFDEQENLAALRAMLAR